MIIINFAIQFGYLFYYFINMLGSKTMPQFKNFNPFFPPSISYYGLWLWFPELLNRLDIYYKSHNESVSVCEVVGFKPNSTEGPFDHCKDATPPDNQVFINAFIIAVAPLPANIWTIFHMDKLGRKFFLGIN